MNTSAGEPMENNLRNSNYVFRVDKFTVPAAARNEFLDRARATHRLLRAMPGFVEDHFLEQTGDPTDLKFVTIVVWENAQAFDAAKSAVQQHYRSIGFSPGELVQRLGIKAEMAAYSELKT